MKWENFVILVDKVRYKDNFRIKLLPPGCYYGGLFNFSPEPNLIIIMAAPDVGDSSHAVRDIVFRTRIPLDIIEKFTIKGALNYIRNQILDFETHEMDEWLKLGSINVVNPHPEQIEQPRTVEEEFATFVAKSKLMKPAKKGDNSVTVRTQRHPNTHPMAFQQKGNAKARR